MSLFLDNCAMQQIKSPLSRRWEDDHVFTYQLDSVSSSRQIDLILCQEETDFTISMTCQVKKNELFVKRFTLDDNKYLEKLSSALYDAAIIEITLQALNLLFLVAEENNYSKMIFLMSGNEINRFIFFDKLFNKGFSRTAFQEKNIVYTIPTTQEAYDLFVKQAKSVNTHIRQELWKRQRGDIYLRRYLQQGESLFSNRAFPMMDLVISVGKVDHYQCATPTRNK